MVRGKWAERFQERININGRRRRLRDEGDVDEVERRGSGELVSVWWAGSQHTDITQLAAATCWTRE